MSTVKVVPDKTWSLPTFSTEPSTSSSTDYLTGNSVTNEEYPYIFCIFLCLLFFLWTFKKRV